MKYYCYYTRSYGIIKIVYKFNNCTYRNEYSNIMCVLKFNQETGKQHVEVYEQDKHVDASCIVPYYIYKDTLENNR